VVVAVVDLTAKTTTAATLQLETGIAVGIVILTVIQLMVAVVALAG
jgi:hypothetical protein